MKTKDGSGELNARNDGPEHHDAQALELPDDALDQVAAGALDRGLVSALAQHFGWSAGQVNRILDADQVPTAPRPAPSMPKTDRSPPTMG